MFPTADTTGYFSSQTIHARLNKIFDSHKEISNVTGSNLLVVSFKLKISKRIHVYFISFYVLITFFL